MECEFCEIEKIEKDLIIASNKKCTAFMSIEPIKEGHVLIAPKRHVREIDEFTKEEFNDLMALMVKANKVLQKTFDVKSTFSFTKHGEAKSKEHFHVHVIPGFVPIREALVAYKFSPRVRDRKSLEELAVVAKRIRLNVGGEI